MTKLVSANPKPITSTGSLQKIQLNKPANHYAWPKKITDSLDRREIMITVFVDFKSAYDYVWTVKLTDKLQATGGIR